MSEVHQYVMRGSSKGEIQDKISDFFVQHGDNVRVLDVFIKDDVAKIVYEWSIRTQRAARE